MKSNVKAAWVAASIAIIGTVMTVISGFLLRSYEMRESREHEIRVARQAALFKALEVLDHIYANTSLDGLPASNPHEWDLAKAHTAVNEMIVYCQNPGKAVDIFYRAASVINPTTDHLAPTQSLKYLDEFRQLVCAELGLPMTSFKDTNRTWITSMPGGRYKDQQ